MNLATTIPTITHDFTVADYYKMAEAGILDQDDRVELLEGKIVDMPPIGPLHQSTLDRLGRWLNRNIDDKAIVRSRGPIRLGERSEPKPDFSLLRDRPDFYLAAHPTAQDILLVMEISDSTLYYDRKVKVPLYARAGIPELWIFNLDSQEIEVYRKPGAEGYEEAFTIDKSGSIAPLAFPDMVLTTEEIFG